MSTCRVHTVGALQWQQTMTALRWQLLAGGAQHASEAAL